MKRKLLTLMILSNLLLIVPLATYADTKTFTPKPKRGFIYVAVKFKDYNSRDLNPKTKVKITWGGFEREKSYSAGFFRIKGTSGVIIKLRHSKGDSVQLTVQTDGTVMGISQDTVPNFINYQNDSW